MGSWICLKKIIAARRELKIRAYCNAFEPSSQVSGWKTQRMGQFNHTVQLQNQEITTGSAMDGAWRGSLNPLDFLQHFVCVSATWEKIQLPSSDFQNIS